MSYNDNEGPQEMKIPARTFISCSGCKFYHSNLVKSGRNPIYASNCEHPEIKSDMKRFNPFEGNLHRNILGIIETPEWCPYLKPKDNDKAKTTS